MQVDAERQIEARIAERVPPGLRRDLEHLLEETVDAGVTRFVWLRQFEPGSNSADANRLRALMAALQERYHREVGSKFGLARGERGSTAVHHQPIDRVAGVKDRIEEERRSAHADGEAAGRETAAADHRVQLEEVQRQHRVQVEDVQRQHRVQLDGVQKDLAATKTARDNEAKRANGLHHLQQNVLNMLLERVARVTVLRSVLLEVFDKAGYRLEFDTAEGQTWRYAAKPEPPPVPTPPRPAPVQTPQPASRDRSTGPAL